MVGQLTQVGFFHFYKVISVSFKLTTASQCYVRMVELVRVEQLVTTALALLCIMVLIVNLHNMRFVHFKYIENRLHSLKCTTTVIPEQWQRISR